MQKTAGKIALIFMVIMLAHTVAGCSLMIKAVVDKVGDKALRGIGEATVEGISNAVENSRYKKAAEIVVQYDEVDTF